MLHVAMELIKYVLVILIKCNILAVSNNLANMNVNIFSLGFE